MHFLYIIHSKKYDKYYIGKTSNVEKRLQRHKEKYYDKAFTKISKDWELVLKFECDNRTQAFYLERFVKRMKSRTFLKKLIKIPEILTDILNKKNS